MQQRGFTLLEILVALAIFTIIGLAANEVLSRVIDNNNASIERFERLQTLQRAMTTIERDLLQLVPRAVRIEGESNTMVMTGGSDLFESEADGIGFTRAGWQNPKLMLRRSTLQLVAYRLQEKQLQRLYGNYVDNVIGYEPKVRTVLDGVDDFQVEFLAQQDKDPQDPSSWAESYSSYKLPYAVAFIIETEEFGQIRREFLVAVSDISEPAEQGDDEQ